MLKYFALLIIGLSSIDNALSLHCFATDVDALTNSRVLSHSVQNCDNYIDNMMSKFGLGVRTSDFPTINCYTVKVTTNNPATNFVVKGCVPNGYCDSIVKTLIQDGARQQGVLVTNMRCNECVGNTCNRL